MNSAENIDLEANESTQKQLDFAGSVMRSTPVKSFEITEKLESKLEGGSSELLDCLYIQANSLWLLGRFEESIVKAGYLYRLGIEINNELACARSYNISGNVFYDLGNYERALENYMKGLSIARMLDNKKIEALLTNNIGEIYNSLDAFDDALRYYLMSLEIAKKNNDQYVIGVIYINIGALYYEKDNIEGARSYVSKALDILTVIEDYIGIAYAHLLLGKIYKHQKEFDKAYQELLLSIEIIRRIQDKFNLVQAYEIMIEILIEEGKFEEALDYAEDGLEISNSLNANKEISEIALLIAKIYEAMGDYRKSLDYYKMYSKTKLLYEEERQKEQQKQVSIQIGIEKTIHEKEIYRLKNVELRIKTDEIQKLYENVSIINAIGQDITSTLDIEKVLYLLYKNINILMDASYFGIILYDSSIGTINLNLILENGEKTRPKVISINDVSSISAWCIRNRESIITNDFAVDYIKYKKEYRHNLLEAHISQSIIMVPLIIQNEIIGAVTVQSIKKDAYTDYHFNTIKALASYIAIAIKNSQESQMLALEIKERIKSQKKLELLNRKLSEMSYMDSLTKIPNRRSFVEYFERELARDRRNHEQISLLIVDIDFFKEYNDNYGHVEGDRCIAEIALLLKNSFKREIDFVARYGGDEFVAVLSNTDYAGAKKVAENVSSNIRNRAIEHKFSKIADVLSVTIGGISLIPDKSYTMEKIIHLADSALYYAKDEGRNKCIFYNEMRE